MQRVCIRCKKTVATTVAECKCSNIFHPGCAKAYAAKYRYAERCCLDLAASLHSELEVDGVEPSLPSTALSSAPPTPGVECTELLDFLSPAPAGACTLPQPVTDVMTSALPKLVAEDAATTNALLRQLMDQMRLSEARFEERMKLSEARSEERFSSLDDKLNQLNDLAKSVGRNSQRIAELEHQCAALANEVRDLKIGLKSDLKSELSSELRSDLSSSRLPRSPSSRVSRTSDIIISGIPGSLTDTSEQLVAGVFRALGTPQLISDVLETREVGVSNVSAMHNVVPSTVSAFDRAKPRSIIVILKSREIRDYILAAMRRKRRLTVCDVISKDVPGHIYINELLPANIYNLLRRTREKAKLLSFKHVWCKDGQIFVRKDNRQSPILITTAADFVGLQ